MKVRGFNKVSVKRNFIKFIIKKKLHQYLKYFVKKNYRLNKIKFNQDYHQIL
jgi:hypothetical protein